MNTSIFFPVLAQIAIVIILYVYLGNEKSKALKSGAVNEKRRTLYDDAWPQNIVQINNCIRNQFEIPILFYVLVFILQILDAVNVYIHLLSWCFVVSRMVHAYIHIGSNVVAKRRKVFMFGSYIVVLLFLFSIYAVFENSNSLIGFF